MGSMNITDCHGGAVSFIETQPEYSGPPPPPREISNEPSLSLKQHNIQQPLWSHKKSRYDKGIIQLTSTRSLET